MEATAKDLRFHAKELLDSVRRGEEVVITYHGKPCARLIAYENREPPQAASDDVFGMWSDHAETEDVRDFVDRARRPRT